MIANVGQTAWSTATGQLAARPGDEVSVGGGFVGTTEANAVSCTGKEEIFQAYMLTRA